MAAPICELAYCIGWIIQPNIARSCVARTCFTMEIPLFEYEIKLTTTFYGNLCKNRRNWIWLINLNFSHIPSALPTLAYRPKAFYICQELFLCVVLFWYFFIFPHMTSLELVEFIMQKADQMLLTLLTHWGHWVTHMYVSELGHHCSGNGLAPHSAYLMSVHRNDFLWDFNLNMKFLNKKNTF